MKSWQQSPAEALAQHFRETVYPRMADLPFLNAALQVEAIGFRQLDMGHWVGVLLTPWSCSLMCLPGPSAQWPEATAGAKYSWSFASGEYEFVVAQDEALGLYHQCPLFTGVQHFSSQEEARLTGLAVMLALEKPQMDVPDAPRKPADASESPEETVSPADAAVRSRRAFLGLGRA